MIKTEAQSINFINESNLPVIPILLPIIEDETFTGWLNRVARANGVGVDHFYNVFCQYFGKDKENYICISNLEKICEANKRNSAFPDVMNVLKKHSTYFGALPFNYLKQNILIAESILRDNEEGFFLINRLRTLMKKSLICPLCAMEDIERYGAVVSHTAHQFPGVTSCWKHRVKLVEKSQDLQCLTPIKATEKENTIAMFMKKMYESPIPLCREDIVQMVRSQAIPLRITNLDNCSSLVEKITSAYTPDCFIQEAKAYSLKKNYPNSYGNFTCIEKTNLPIIKVSCNDCGKVFYTHQDAFSVGCGCPKCNKHVDIEELVTKALDHQYNGQFKIVRMNPRNKVSVVHKPCGTETNRYISRLIWRKGGCSFCRRKTIELWQVKADKERKKFKVIDIIKDDANRRKLIVEHVGAGHEFSVSPQAFINSPFCRICEAGSSYDFRSEWEKTNTGYRIIKKYTRNKISILHDRCGTISCMRPKEWVLGQRCFLCGYHDDTSYSQSYLKIKSLIDSGKKDIDLSDIDPVDLETLKKHEYIKIGWNGEITIPVQQEYFYKTIDKYYKNIKGRIGQVIKANNGQYMKIINYKGSTDFDVQFEDGTEVHCNNYQAFITGMIGNPNIKMGKKKPLCSRIGEEEINVDGQKMKIVDYRNHRDLDVIFEDGTIIRHVRYFSFKAGMVFANGRNESCHYEKSPEIRTNMLRIDAGKREERIGETRVMKNGMRAKIINYENSINIDVEFEDGYVARNKRYRNFYDGKIGNPNVPKRIKKDGNYKEIDYQSRVGEEYVATNGMKMRIIEYNSSRDCTVEFEDGEIVYRKAYQEIIMGKIKHPHYRAQTLRNQRNVPKRSFVSKEGLPIRVIAYREYNDCDVIFEDGTIVHHKPLNLIKTGKIKYPTRKKQIGQMYYTKEGRKYSIIDWKYSGYYDIEFEDGTIVKHVKDTDIEEGTINYPMCKHGRSFKGSRIGERHKTRNGMDITIIDYRGYADCDVQFEDGTIVNHLTYAKIKSGKVKP